jgi:hypothetical protein
VPVATAALADVRVRHARESVGRRVEQQLLAGAARLLLPEAARVELLAHLGGLGGEPVADALELGDAEERGPAAEGRRREWSAERAELIVEPRDLIAERAAGGSVVDEERLENWGMGGGQRHVSPQSARSG